MTTRLIIWTLLTIGSTAAWAQQSENAVEPGAGKWKTWVLSSGAQFRLAPPPDSAATADELAYLKDLRKSVDDTARRQIAYWNQGSPAYHWVQWLQARIQSAGVNTPNATRQMAPC